MVPGIEQTKEQLKDRGWARFRYRVKGNTLLEAESPAGTTVRIFGLSLKDCSSTIKNAAMYATGAVTTTQTAGYSQWIRYAQGYAD